MRKMFVALLFMAALPAQASQIIYSQEPFSVDRNTPYGVFVDASPYEALQLSFDYDSRELDAPSSIQNDTFEYGVVIGGVEYVLGTIKGLSGPSAAEISSTSVAIPDIASEGEFTVFARLAANTDSDVVHISNLTVTGEAVWNGVVNTQGAPYEKSGGLVTVCHFDDGTEQFYKETVNIASIIKGKGHGQHGDDVIPLFWYKEGKGGEALLYNGNDWNKTGRTLYLSDCKEGE